MNQNEIVHKCKQGHAHLLLEHFTIMDVHGVTAWNINVQPKHCDPAASCVIAELYQSWFGFARHQQNITLVNIDSLSTRSVGNATQTRQSYRQVSNINRTLIGNKIVDHSDVVGASPYRRCSNYIFILNLTPGFIGLGIEKTTRQYEKHLSFGIWWGLY